MKIYCLVFKLIICAIISAVCNKSPRVGTLDHGVVYRERITGKSLLLEKRKRHFLKKATQ